MNFKEAFKQGQLGKNKGLSTGIRGLNRATNGINRKSLYTVAAPPKVGKSTLVDYSFVLSPYLEWLSLHVDGVEPYPIEWIYYSFEVDRVQKEFKFASFFFWNDYEIFSFEYEGQTYEMNSEYLMGKKRDSKGEIILVSEEHKLKVQEIYEKRIIPLFGEYDENGKLVKPGKIIFIENKENPTGIRNHLIAYAKEHGTVIKEAYSYLDKDGRQATGERVLGYKPHNPDKWTIIILDHVRKLPRERGFSIKENIDKMAEYFVEIRNLTGMTIVVICHMNRNIVDPMRLKLMGETLFATSDDIKDSGNLSEESDYVLTMFNPNDDKYSLKKHFGVDLRDKSDNQILPKYRSIHLVESRHTECPVHIQTNMLGNINLFEPLPIKK